MIRLPIAGELAREIGRNGDAVPRDASIRPQLTQAGIGQDSGWLNAIGVWIPLGDGDFYLSQGLFIYQMRVQDGVINRSGERSIWKYFSYESLGLCP